MDFNQVKRIYFIGISGTGMASVAGLCKELNYQVAGSDVNTYPPMSDLLAQMEIPVATPYDQKNLEAFNPDLVVVGNCLGASNCEVAYANERGIPHTSFANLVGELVLRHRSSIVVTGTHGKTTITSLLAHLLVQMGEDPGFLVGGIPQNFSRSFANGRGPLFVIEGDEYDTAYFDKDSKFLNYYPKYLIFNNLEFDHADIFADLASIERMFTKLIHKVQEPRKIIANVDDSGVSKLLADLSLSDKVYRVATLGKATDYDLRVNYCRYNEQAKLWEGQLEAKGGQTWQLSTQLAGEHNMANIAQCWGLFLQLKEFKELGNTKIDDLLTHIGSFKNVKRRLDHLGTMQGIDIYEDFAHHPTAVEKVLHSFKTIKPNKRLVVAFEPRNASSRRNVFSKRYAEALNKADVVLLGACPQDARIPDSEKMNTKELAESIGHHAHAFDQNESLLAWLKENLDSEDAVLFMSSGSFSSIPTQLLHSLGKVN